MATYSIVRYFMNHPQEIIRTGLTLEEVQAHCSDPDTSSRSTTDEELRKITADRGPWFDGWEEE